MNTPLDDALALVERPQDWVQVAAHALRLREHCIGEESVDLAAARIIADAYRETRQKLRETKKYLRAANRGAERNAIVSQLLAARVNQLWRSQEQPLLASPTESAPSTLGADSNAVTKAADG